MEPKRQKCVSLPNTMEPQNGNNQYILKRKMR